MPYRQFTDPDGAVWDVWEVRPAAAEEALRRAREERAGEGARWTGVAPVNNNLAAGWLCFESGTRKRRLAPVPDGWVEASHDALQELCSRATAVRRRATGDRTSSATETARS